MIRRGEGVGAYTGNGDNNNREGRRRGGGKKEGQGECGSPTVWRRVWVR